MECLVVHRCVPAFLDLFPASFPSRLFPLLAMKADGEGLIGGNMFDADPHRSGGDTGDLPAERDIIQGLRIFRGALLVGAMQMPH